MLSGKYQQKTILYNVLGVYKLDGRPTVFGNLFCQQKFWQLGLKGTEMGQNEGKIMPRVEPRMQRTELEATKDYSQALKSNEIFPAGFWTSLECIANI